MCYDVSFKVEIRQLVDYFPDLVFDEQISIDFDKAVHIMAHAYGLHPVIYQHREDGAPHCRLMEWGCIPFYVKDEVGFKKNRVTMLNARSERILDDPKSYWYKIKNRRCLMPVTGIYEHREIPGWKKKVPYYVQLKDQLTFFIPGLYSVAELPDRETGEMQKRYTYTIITRPANAVMQQIHNGGENKGRMPLFVPIDMAIKWLKEELTADEYKEILAFEMPSEALSYHTVDTIRSPKPRADNKSKDEPFAWPGLPELTL